jgi:hypothetical protein
MHMRGRMDSLMEMIIYGWHMLRVRGHGDKVGLMEWI